jgi:hypothetical protein
MKKVVSNLLVLILMSLLFMAGNSLSVSIPITIMFISLYFLIIFIFKDELKYSSWAYGQYINKCFNVNFYPGISIGIIVEEESIHLLLPLISLSYDKKYKDSLKYNIIYFLSSKILFLLGIISNQI